MTKEFIERKDLFPTPVWRYKLTDWEAHKPQVLNYLLNNDIYFSEYERTGVQASEVNLFDVLELKPVTDFLYDCLKDVMVQLGYVPDIGLTSMWANRYRPGGFIKQHVHTNCFLAVVFYAYDQNNHAGGTVFHDSQRNVHIIRPRALDNSNLFFKPDAELDFEEGTCAVFPSWALHSTMPSQSEYRIIIAADAVPIGRTNLSHYEQYVFPDPKDFGILTLEEDVNQGYLKVRKQ